MDENYIIISDANDIYKNITATVSDYINSSRFADTADIRIENEESPKYIFGPHNLKTPAFSIGMDINTECINGLYVFDTRATSNVYGSFSVKPGYFKNYIPFKSLIELLNIHSSLYYVITGSPDDYPVSGANDDSILKYFSICYLEDGRFIRCDNSETLADGNALCLFAAYKMGNMPIYHLVINSGYLGFSSCWSDFKSPEANAVGNSVLYNSFPYKTEIFNTNILSHDIEKIDKYIIYVNDIFEFEIFGIQNMKSFKEQIVNFKDFLSVQTNLDYTVSDLGVITVDTSRLTSGQMGYIKVKIDSGDFFNNIVYKNQRMFYEYVLIKK